jgi:hypothetical protein
MGASRADAQVTTYSGNDAGASAPGANSQAARNAFTLATGGAVGIDFESALPAGASISGGTVKTTPFCLPLSLCGGNTTTGGSFFLELFGSQATFNFTTPISYFGAYFGGLQWQNLITFNDGTARTINIPFSDINGGFSFTGFTSQTGGISSVTIVTGNAGFNGEDIISVDDVIFGNQITATPEPASMALVGTGLFALGAFSRRRGKERTAA